MGAKLAGLRERIKDYLRSGEKRPSDIIKLCRGEASERTIRRVLRDLCKWKEISKRKDGRKMWYRLMGEEVLPILPDFPPFDEAPGNLVDERLSKFESALGIKKGWANWVERISSMVELGRVMDYFSDLCHRYKNVAYSLEAVGRIFKILDCSENYPKGLKTSIVLTFAKLFQNSLLGKDNPEIISEGMRRLEWLRKVCLEEESPNRSLAVLDVIRTISEDKAKELIVEMVGIEKYPTDDLLNMALSLYHGDFGKLKEELDKLHERSDLYSKRRIEEFKRKLEQALKL